jgi:hypothetical protein
MKKYYLLLVFFLIVKNIFSQGLNHQFLLGYESALDVYTTSKRSILFFDTNNIQVLQDSFKMAFNATQANISDEQGNLLMYANGCWIADATGDTMQNGNNINPGSHSASYCNNFSGLNYPSMSAFLTYPGDTNLVLFVHHACNDGVNINSDTLFYSIIDKRINNGLGAVTQKRLVARKALGSRVLPAMSIVQHGNGRDWWVVTVSKFSDSLDVSLFTPTGVINYPRKASGFSGVNNGYGGLNLFSPDGTKFAFRCGDSFSTGGGIAYTRVLDFDRCTGLFTNPRQLNDTVYTQIVLLNFSPNSKYLYSGNLNMITQINLDSVVLSTGLDTVCQITPYCWPYSGLTCNKFMNGYLAANGKIYISSANSMVEMNYINHPDSNGVACDVQQHALRLPCYVFRSHVFHPNYYLGPAIGSACDSLPHVGLQENLNQVQNFKLYPNPSPSSSEIKISYLLPQNKEGRFFIYDNVGKLMYNEYLPPWSTLQYIQLPTLANGVYTCIIRSNNNQQVQKLVIVN